MQPIARNLSSVRKPLIISALVLLALVLVSAFTRRRSFKCRVQGATNPAIPLDRLPKFSDIKINPLCHQLPDASATYIWSQLNLHGEKLRPSMMKRLIQNSPSRAHVQRLANRIIETSDNPIRILVILPKAQVETKWPQRLQVLVNDALGTTRVKIHASSIYDENQVLERAEEATIVVDCRGVDEMKLLRIKFSDLTVLPDAGNFLHEFKQRQIRSILTTTAIPPLLILVGESPRNQNPLSSSVYSRTVQRLAHWYQLGYVVMKEKDAGETLEQTLAFAILVWLQDYCSSTPLETRKALLPRVQRLAEQVIPPSLELSTTWQSVSAEWHRMEQPP